eukprot:GILK01012768.1.p1 GENE.GILK01012768.1~~GILK01012768.1.p1  ORF type:complete len:434 (-),score=44.27 GILK01012768.1:418-1719(-)
MARTSSSSVFALLSSSWCLLLLCLAPFMHSGNEPSSFLSTSRTQLEHKVYFKEEFDTGWEARWAEPKWRRNSDMRGTWQVSAGDFYGDPERDRGLQTTQNARFYKIAASFEPFSNENRTLVVQYTVKHPQGMDCGGGYLKLMPPTVDMTSIDFEAFNIMFGPDICGSSTHKTHIIFQSGGKTYENKKTISAETDRLSHLYTLILHPDNTYEVQIDQKSVASGNLKEDYGFLPPRHIKDPHAYKPHNWIDDLKMADPTDKKPQGWDDAPEQIADPTATKPVDWMEEEDGEWSPPLIDNPEYKGEWTPRLIPNPNYKGEWVHPLIDNPNFTDDNNMYKYTFGAVGFDLWQVKSGTIFDHLIITDSIYEAKKYADATWFRSKDAEKRMMESYDEEKRRANLNTRALLETDTISGSQEIEPARNYATTPVCAQPPSA